MSETGTPTRRWFQFHLSTAVVFVVVAGAILGANIKGLTLSGSPKTTNGAEISELVQYGFPVRIYLHVKATMKSGGFYEGTDVNGLGLFIDAAIPFLGAMIAEYLIRRREGRES